ncbi:MAG: hypothetical protein FWG68_07420 [Defluviitaleaceae bacterium]|nr:hypothetical protein [Defluviitaleaceae bacterium]
MKNNKLTIFLILIIPIFFIVATLTIARMTSDTHANFSSFSARETGASLLFDTLNYMQYPVAVLYSPVTPAINTDYAILIIQPSNPRPNQDSVEDILNWVRIGGRLIFLESNRNNLIEQAMGSHSFASLGTLRLYSLGMGEIITGDANAILNGHLMANAIYGERLTTILSIWNAERVYFAEYYHGYRADDNLFRQLPLWLRLVAVQLLAAAAACVWHFGKRFGSPIPLYEEIEREENEQVLVLARLYRHADKKFSKKRDGKNPKRE